MTKKNKPTKKTPPRRSGSAAGRPHLGLGAVGDVWLTPKPNGGFSAGVWMRDATGRRRQVTASGPTKGEARRALTRKVEAATIAPTTGVQPAWTLETLLHHWFAQKKRTGHAHRRAPLRPQTLWDYERLINNVLVPAIGKISVHELSVPVVENALLDLEESGVAVDGTRKILNQALNLALRDGAIGFNPLALIPTTPREDREVDALDVDQAARLLDLIHPDTQRIPGRRRPNRDLYDCCALLLATGARISELLAVRRMDVNETDGLMTITISGTLVEPKTGYIERHHRQDGTKGGHDRVLAIPEPAAELIRHRLATAAVKEPDAPLLQSGKGKYLWAANIRSRLRTAVADSPEFAKTTPHTLRRTVGTLLAWEIGVDAARQQLGHSLTGSTPIARYVAHRRQVIDYRHLLERLVVTARVC